VTEHHESPAPIKLEKVAMQPIVEYVDSPIKESVESPAVFKLQEIEQKSVVSIESPRRI
jgi:hypothetical protein